MNRAHKKRTIADVLLLLFGRLYVPRNQLVHGCATWNGKRNRPQVEDGYKVISKLQPLFLRMMLNNPNLDWGGASYDPYVEGFNDY